MSSLRAAMPYAEPIDDLSAQYAEHPSADLLRELAEQRILRAAELLPRDNERAWRAPSQTPFSLCTNEIPEIDRQAMNVDAIGSAVHHHGALIVRGLLSTAETGEYREQMDKAFSSQEMGGDGEGWFSPPRAMLEHPLCRPQKFVRETGSMWTASSPKIMQHLFEQYESLGLRDILESYLGEPPLVSVKKWVLRRIEPLTQASDWHQDGAFMGADVKSLNLWIALSDCGGKLAAPGMDIMPGRFSHIVETGTDDAAFSWSVGQQTAADAVDGAEPLIPEFRAGDALFFDHFNLHRTSFNQSYKAPRYAIECWFLGASNYPVKQVPLLW